MAAEVPEINHRPEISKEDILKTAGGSRAVASGMYSLIFSFASTAVLWLFIVAGSGHQDQVSYFGENGFINGIVGIISAGFSQAYIAQVKKNTIKNPKSALQVASIYTRFLVFYGIIASIICLVLGLVLPPFPSSTGNIPLLLKNTLLFSVPQTLLNYCILSPMFWSLQVVNRYDITAFVGALGGAASLGFGFIFLAVGAPSELFAFIGTINAVLNVPLIAIFFRRHSPFRFKSLLTVSPLLQDKEKTLNIIRYASLTTLSNMETFQLISNVNMVLTSIALNYFYSSQAAIGISLLTTINIYSQLKSALTLFASPLNVELAEAYAKEDKSKMTEILNQTVRFSYFVGLALVTGFCGLSGVIFRNLHTNSFIINDVFDESLFQTVIFVAIILSVGQAGFGIANLFANALIGTGNAPVSAKVYLFALIVSGLLTPFCIIVLQLGFAGIAWSTLIVGVIAGGVMEHEVQQRLKVKIDSRLKNMLPLFGLLFLIVFFVPYGKITGVVFTDIAIAIAIMVVFYMLGLSFFGVFQDERDWTLLHDIYISLGMRRFADQLVRLAKFMYNLNPFHRGRKVSWRVPRHQQRTKDPET